MFRHIFCYNLKADLRDRDLVFWTVAFPLILASLFGLVFANISNSEVFNKIPVAVVNNVVWQQDTQLQSVMEQVSSGENALFDLRLMTEAEAMAELAEDKIRGILTPRRTGDSLTALDVTATNSGLSQSIIKTFADEYQQVSTSWMGVLALDPTVDMAALQQTSERDWLADRPLGSGSPDTMMTYYYALIAMTCLYGGFWGLKEVMNVQANQSAQATRIVVSPISRPLMILASSAAKFLVHFSSILLLLIYLRFALNIGFGDDLWRILLVCFLGSVLGVSIGALISSLFNVREGARVGILIGFSMVSSAMAGLNSAQVKYAVSQNAPILSWLNPANLISDSFYALYYYETDTRFWNNIIVMSVMIVVFGAVVAFKLRRQRYASI